VDAPAQEEHRTAPTPALRLLVVDDNDAVRNAYRESLEEMGYSVMLADSGEEALQMAEQSSPDVVLIDIHLPTMNGYQVARHLRARDPARRMKLLMLSGMALDTDLVRLSRKAGFDDCVDKGGGPQAIDRLLRPNGS
jgi:CheY-like chemotaxis protein